MFLNCKTRYVSSCGCLLLLVTLLIQLFKFNILTPNFTNTIIQSEKHGSLAQTKLLHEEVLVQQENIKINISALPQYTAKGVDCSKLFAADNNEVIIAKTLQESNAKVEKAAQTYSRATKDCKKYRKDRRYILNYMTEEERDFPIAFSIMMFQHVEQVERLLRAIYRPQNYYCIHVDAKANGNITQAIDGIANCFENVFMASRSINVNWGHFSVLEADLICMKDLLKHKKWRYFINLTGQEFPLHTNYELVKILQTYNGANDMEGTFKRRNKERFEYVHIGATQTRRKKDPPPHKIIPVKGSVHITASRAFVEYAIFNQVAKDFLTWVRDAGIPDESFFSTLDHSPHLGVPGAYKGEPETDPKKNPFITRFKNWGTYPFDYPCAGQRVRMVCIFSIGDLPLLKTRKELFANKFYLDWQPLALDCMEELYFNRTRMFYSGELTFDNTYYKSLPFVKNHI